MDVYTLLGVEWMAGGRWPRGAGGSSRCFVTAWKGGMGGVGGEMRGGGDEGTCVYVWLIHFVVEQGLTHHCGEIVLQ